MITRIRIRGFPVEIDMENRHGVRWWAEIREQLRRKAVELYESAIQEHDRDESQSEASIIPNIDDPHESHKSCDRYDPPCSMPGNQSNAADHHSVSADTVSYEPKIDWSLANLDWPIAGSSSNLSTLSNHFLRGYS
jgi:hypothetical protein